MNHEINHQILIDPAYRWKTGQDRAFRYWYVGSPQFALVIVQYVIDHPEANSAAIIKQFQDHPDANGHHAFIVETERLIIAAVDKIRSYPLFYAQTPGSFYVSNSARALKKECGLQAVHEQALLEFRMSGYVSGRETLCESLFQLQSGEFLIWDRGRRQLERARYYYFYASVKFEMTLDQGVERLVALTEGIFSRLINSLRGRRAMLPLSGGLDSRLIACMFKKSGYDNVLTYSYGLKNNWESTASREIAARLGFKWIFVPYTNQLFRQRYKTQELTNYFQFSDGLCTLPFIQDLFAIESLKERDAVPDDAVFINGNSGDFSTGGHIPRPTDGAEDLVRSAISGIIAKHFSLWEKYKTDSNLARISQKIQKQLEEIIEEQRVAPGSLDPAALYEVWEWQERQSKFVVNGQRVYDYFGYDWLLPHWDDLYLDFWRKVPTVLKYGQALYKKYLETQDFFNLFKDYRPQRYVKPPWIRPLRFIAKSALLPFGKEAWHQVEKTFFNYFTDNMQTYGCFPYGTILKSRGKFRNSRSFRTEHYVQSLLSEFDAREF